MWEAESEKLFVENEKRETVLPKNSQLLSTTEFFLYACTLSAENH